MEAIGAQWYSREAIMKGAVELAILTHRIELINNLAPGSEIVDCARISGYRALLGVMYIVDPDNAWRYSVDTSDEGVEWLGVMFQTDSLQYHRQISPKPSSSNYGLAASDHQSVPVGDESVSILRNYPLVGNSGRVSVSLLHIFDISRAAYFVWQL